MKRFPPRWFNSDLTLEVTFSPLISSQVVTILKRGPPNRITWQGKYVLMAFGSKCDET